jgi:hypothetical protein
MVPGFGRGHNNVKHIYICFNGKNLFDKPLTPKKVQIYLHVEDDLTQSQVVKPVAPEQYGPHAITKNFHKNQRHFGLRIIELEIFNNGLIYGCSRTVICDSPLQQLCDSELWWWGGQKHLYSSNLTLTEFIHCCQEKKIRCKNYSQNNWKVNLTENYC